jgi:hypothetical protein
LRINRKQFGFSLHQEPSSKSSAAQTPSPDISSGKCGAAQGLAGMASDVIGGVWLASELQ